MCNYSSLSNKHEDGIKVVRGRNFEINKRGGGISMSKEITVTRSIEARRMFKVPKFSQNYL